MAVSVTIRPSGYIKDGSAVAIDQISNDNGRVLISKNGHTLSSVFNEALYFSTIVDRYNGWKTSEYVNSGQFYLKELDGSYVQYISSPDVSLTTNIYFLSKGRFVLSHTWNCVHLPIVYKLSNTLWPANSADTVRTISSVTDSNGYCALALSGDIKDTGSAAALEFVKITGATDDDLNGVWQIIAYTNETTFTIDIAYSSANDTALTSATIQYYYNNYHIKVQVWGGLNNGHEYYAQEPYELLATLDLVPDENNEVKFSIHEILKKNIEVKNNLLLGTLPNNLDAWTGFFIKYAEVYDDSDGTTLTTTTPSYTSDMTVFEGKALNAILPFKNVYSGALSEYISADSNQKFLTAFTRPTIFEGKYFDLSFLWDGVNTVAIKKNWYIDSALLLSEYDIDIDCFYTGVYRFQIEHDCDYDRVDITAYQLSPYPLAAPSAWTDVGTPFTSKTATQFTVITGSGGARGAYTPLIMSAGEILVFSFSVNYTSGSTTNVSVSFTLTDSSGIQIGTQYLVNNPVDDQVYEVEITAASSLVARLLIEEQNGGASYNFQINMPSTYKVIGSAISETKTIDINCDCIRSKATGYYLSWLNNLGGFDSWLFTGYADELIDIVDTGETEENSFPEWPNSYGEFADTQRKQTYRTSRRQRLIRSQHVTEAQLSAIENIRTSPLVQIVNSIYDRRTVLVDADSFVSFKEENNLHDISFTITYTDDVPSQKV